MLILIVASRKDRGREVRNGGEIVVGLCLRGGGCEMLNR